MYVAEKFKLGRDIKINIMGEIKEIKEGTEVIALKEGFLWKGITVTTEDIRYKADSYDSETLAKYIVDNCGYFEEEDNEDEEGENEVVLSMCEVNKESLVDNINMMLSKFM